MSKPRIPRKLKKRLKKARWRDGMFFTPVWIWTNAPLVLAEHGISFHVNLNHVDWSEP